MKRLRDWSRRLKRMALGQSIEKSFSPAVKRVSRSLQVQPLEDRRVLAVTVEAFMPTPSGFTTQLSEEIRLENLNLYNSQSGGMGAADVTLQGTTGGNIRGSLVVDGTNLTFVASGGVLPADSYTATLRSSADGIVDAALGQLLDGEFNGSFPSGDGNPGGDFVFSFTVSAVPALVVSLPDFARGPAQPINVPAVGSGTAPQTGLPIRFSQTSGITSFTTTITYDPGLLDITDVQLGVDSPAGSQVEANFDVTGQVTIAFFTLEPLTSGQADLIQLVASVPANAVYGNAHALDITAIEVNAGAIQAIGDSAIHVVAFPGDSNGNGRYDAEDARLIARVGVGLDTGFVASPSTGSATNPRLFALIDPVIIGDVTGVDGISPLDASDILRKVVGLPTPNIPALPSTQAPTSISLSNNTISEDSPIGTTVGTFSTIDPDAGDTHTYTLVTGTGAIDNAAFQIVGNELRNAVAIDFDSQATYSIRVRSTDSGGLFTEQVFTITATPVNEAPTAISLSNLTIAENAPLATVVGTLTTTDPNASDTHTYTLVSGVGSADNVSFNVSGNQIVSASTFDFETKSSYTIRVRSTDSGGLFTEQSFVIAITNVNEPPTSIALSDNTAPDAAPIGTVVGTLSSVDPDVGDTHTYTLVSGTGDSDNASFTIAGNELRTAVVLDLTSQASYSIRIRSTDAGGLFTEETFVITVTEINVAPTAILLDTLTIPENEDAGTAVGNLSSADANTVDTHTYTIVAGDGDDDNASFAISGSQLVTTEVFDFETKSSYSVRIRTTDSGGLFFEDFFVINVTDVNEAPTAITLNNSTALDLSPIGTIIGQFSTTDVDAGDTHTYSLVAGDGDTHNTSFEIVGNELRTLVALDFTTTPTYSIRVRTTDSGDLTFEQVFTITETA